MIRSIISDLGRVIIFFDNNIFFRKIAEYSPFSAEEIAEMVSGHSDIIVSFDTGKITPYEFYSRACKVLQINIDYDAFFPVYNDVFSLNPSALCVLKKLRSKYRLILLSNTDVMRFNFVKEKFPEIFFFDDYILSFEVGFMKPHPRIYEEALKRAGAKASECVFIDDREENVESAEEFGMNTILFGLKTDIESELKGKGVNF